MALPKIIKNLKQAEPTLRDVLDVVKNEVKQEINCHALGTIQSFDSIKQTAVVSVNYTKTYFERDGSTDNYIPKEVDYPILLDCPVIVLSGGLAGLTMPIKAGDQCLMLFNDRSIDNWHYSGQKGPVAHTRMHSISDGLCLVGVRSSNKAITGYDADKAVIFNDKTKIALGAEKISVFNDTKNLNTILQNLITVLVSLTVVDPISGPLPLSPAIIMQLNQVATDLGGLLE